eukprot:Skav231589  [mRNA]  locus=scaffold232:122084:122296:- [translate_table: standard]
MGPRSWKKGWIFPCEKRTARGEIHRSWRDATRRSRSVSSTGWDPFIEQQRATGEAHWGSSGIFLVRAYEI